MALARKIAYNVVFNSALKVTSTVFIALLSIRLITGYLGQEGFGEYATVLAFFAFFGAIGDLGLANITAREIAKPTVNEAEFFGKVAALRICASAAIILVAPLILFWFHYSLPVKGGIALITVALLFAQFSTLLNGIFQKRLAMDRVAMVEFAGKILQFLLIYLAVHFDLGFLAIVSAVLFTMVFNASVALILSRKFITFHFSWDYPFWRRFMHDAWPLGLTALITFAYFKLDTIILSLLQPAAHVGIYNVAYKIMENLIFFPAMLVGLILPLLSRAHHTDQVLFREIAEKTAKVFIAIVLPIVIVTLFLAPDIVAIVSGGGFEISADVLRILIVSLAGIFFGHYFNMLILVGNAQKKLMKALAVVAVVNVSLNVILIREFSYFGAAISSAVTEVLVVLLSGAIAYRALGFFPKPDRLPRIFLSAGVMALVIVIAAPLPFVAILPLAGVSYGLLLWLTRAVTSQEVMSVFSSKGESAAEPLETISA
ncbi:MAG: flippase [Candidatus Moraniibacteriota bacterium]